MIILRGVAGGMRIRGIGKIKRMAYSALAAKSIFRIKMKPYIVGHSTNVEISRRHGSTWPHRHLENGVGVAASCSMCVLSRIIGNNNGGRNKALNAHQRA